MSCCNICLDPVRNTRQNTELPCKHLFHSSCINDWISQGKNTCPVCRKCIKEPKYTLTMTLRNTDSNVSSTTGNLSNVAISTLMSRLNIEDEEILSSDITFELPDILSLEEILDDLSIDLSSFNPDVFYTEGATEP